MEGARRPLLTVAVALFGIVATVFSTDSLNDTAGWLLLGVGLTLLIEWAALEIIYNSNNRERND